MSVWFARRLGWKPEILEYKFQVTIPFNEGAEVGLIHKDS